ncbi:MAG: antitoxin HigA [Pseudomonadota bacterium]|nr:antitoxin HigA [Pseudomonadota bacterium]
MTRMHNPPHPGTVLREWIPEGMSVTQAAADLYVSRVSLSKILNGKTGISADMAIRLSRWLGTSPDLWIGLQAQYDLWQALKRKQPKIQPLLKEAA